MTGQWVPRRHKDTVAGRLQSEDPGEARMGCSADRRLGRCRGVVGWGVGRWANQRFPLATPAIHVEMRSSRATLPSPTSWRMRLAMKVLVWLAILNCMSVFSRRRVARSAKPDATNSCSRLELAHYGSMRRNQVNIPDAADTRRLYPGP